MAVRYKIASATDSTSSHGKSRPSLKAHIQKNTEEEVRDTTFNGFLVYTTESTDLTPKWPDNTRKSLNQLTKLKGVGPATASLLLSTYTPEKVPFFSDELFRWCLWEDGECKGWDREIKYTAVEYALLGDKVRGFKARFQTDFGRDVSALDVEKVAYVLGKRAEPVVVGAPKKYKPASKKRKAATKEDPDERDFSQLPYFKGLAKAMEDAFIDEATKERYEEEDPDEMQDWSEVSGFKEIVRIMESACIDKKEVNEEQGSAEAGSSRRKRRRTPNPT